MHRPDFEEVFGLNAAYAEKVYGDYLHAPDSVPVEWRNWFEAALPPVVTQSSLARVRALRGLLIVPTDDPQVAYFFPDRSMAWFTSGMGAIAVINEAEGFIGVRDAAGRDIALQLGQGGEHALLRIRSPDGQVLNFVGCAPTWRS